MNKNKIINKIKSINPETWLIAAIFCFSLVIRLIYSSTPALDTVNESDMHLYEHLGTRFAKGLSIFDWRPYSCPLYPVFLGSLFIIFGKSLLVVRIFQSILSSICVLLTYMIGKKVYNRYVGLIAAVIIAVYKNLIFYVSRTFFETLLIMLLLSSVYIFLKLQEKPSMKWAILAGVSFGLTINSRLPIWPLILPLMLVTLFMHIRNNTAIKKSVLIFMTTGVIAFLMVCPYLVASKKAQPKLSINWSGNQIKSVYNVATGSTRAYLGRLYERMLVIWSYETREEFRNRYKKQGGKGAKIRRHDNSTFVKPWDFERISWVPFVSNRGVWWFLPLCYLGMIAFPIKRWDKVILLYVFIASYTVLQSVVWVKARYTIPFVPFQAIFVAFGLCVFLPAIVKLFRIIIDELDLKKVYSYLRIAGKGMIVVVIGSIVFSIVSAFMVLVVNRYPLTPELRNELSIKKQAVKLNPDDAEARFDLLATYGYTNRLIKGYGEYRKIMKMGPEAGFLKEVIEKYGQLVRDDPSDWKARFRLAFSLHSAGREEDAIKQLEEIIERYPDNVWAYMYAGLAYASIRDRVKAVELFRKAREINPRIAAIHLGLGSGYRMLGRGKAARNAYIKGVFWAVCGW